jgi:hypothetical protein
MMDAAGISLQGMLRGQELQEAYASADIFMMPSESETLGFVVLEVCAGSRLHCTACTSWGSGGAVSAQGMVLQGGLRSRVTGVSWRSMCGATASHGASASAGTSFHAPQHMIRAAEDARPSCCTRSTGERDECIATGDGGGAAGHRGGGRGPAGHHDAAGDHR